MSPEEVHVNRPFQDLGIDSLMAVLARNRLAELSGLALPATIAFDHRNVKALGQFLVRSRRRSVAGVDECASESKCRAGSHGLNIGASMKECLDPTLRFDKIGPKGGMSKGNISLQRRQARSSQ
ncbi:Acyl transferase/acyl hydrolase/lysophospholipase [Penicillium chrysogenum]|jgi:hypothetical protein|uniref:Acyl transferase/acyl hydrolase/lysophospholipase n=1 Tax=Penicillium chrysogenum TaxID=5076 RepID=A0ABQ8WYW9_PENCH|nr:Acyl transferase/acyl hydrolase/lysophospholipase [Penicillium chrysogenum]KAJ5228129.1 Acyl transferase/acyl hydrolase/lysophospholipase [Penicillium chrysogenum]KAJ5257525.1 Acyl transferase/acyl hydrolase/lysophospholipase [Penicillium chrysogenum]KAJ5284234.1 Acyl transferase/acyl hydrolase/lysophospholipase [Penicillium chrysogenum]KAJ6167643.1 Acyl transferase/acyl hydrolase/lysophospholipase [Penicillium chrysogenum]